MRRYKGNMNGERYCANTHTKQIHDLDNEDTKQCQIDEIIQSEHDKAYSSLSVAKNDGYDPCAYCLPNG